MGELNTNQQPSCELQPGHQATAGGAAQQVERPTCRWKQSCLPCLNFPRMGKRKSSSGCSFAVGLSAVSSAEAGQAAAAAAAAAAAPAAAAAAPDGGSPLDSKPHSSAKSKAMQKLKSLGKKVLRPSCICMPATDKDACPQEVVQQQQQQGLVSVQIGTVEVEDKAMQGSGQVQLVAAPPQACPEVDKQQVLPQPSGRNQHLNKLRGIFRQKKPAALVSEQAQCGSAKGRCAESLAEPAAGDFTAAVRAPSGVQPQPEMPSSPITAAGKPSHQVRSL